MKIFHQIKEKTGAAIKLRLRIMNIANKNMLHISIKNYNKVTIKQKEKAVIMFFYSKIEIGMSKIMN